VRFRLSSVEATEVDTTLARLLIEAPRHVAAHLHAPLQSGSIASSSGWGGTGIRRTRTARVSNGSLSGCRVRSRCGRDCRFSGETEADHHASLTLLHALPFTYLHVFPFSVRPDAPAAKLRGQVPPDVIRARARGAARAWRIEGRAYRAARAGRPPTAWCRAGRAVGSRSMTQDYLSVYVRSEAWSGPSQIRGRDRLMPRAPRIYIETYGCQMNVSDSELMFGVLGREDTCAPTIRGGGRAARQHVRRADHAETAGAGRMGELKRYKRPGRVLASWVAWRSGSSRSCWDACATGGPGDRPRRLSRPAGAHCARARRRGAQPKRRSGSWEHYEDVPPVRERQVSAFVTVQRGLAIIGVHLPASFRCTRGPERRPQVG